MKNTGFVALLLLFFLGSCAADSEKSETKTAQDAALETPTEEEVSESKYDSTIFRSNDMETTEYLKLIVNENEKRSWFYWSDKNEDEVKLGVKDIDGFEGLYFFGKKDEVYEIAGSECGFSLFLGEKRLQWYDQIEPECSMERFY